MKQSTSCILFYGPSSGRVAHQQIQEYGDLIGEYGQDGLKADDARSVVEIMGSPPFLGQERKGVVVVGPMDEASSRASDVLLKRLEEYDHTVIQPLLWARSLLGVKGTITSRCINIWCPPDDIRGEDDLYTEESQAIIDAFLGRDLCGIMNAVKGIKECDKFVAALAQNLYQRWGRDSDQCAKMWNLIRTPATQKNCMAEEIMLEFLIGIDE